MYDVIDLTTNCNVTDSQAALGLSQLKKLSLFLQTRRQWVERYRQQLGRYDFIRFLDVSYHNHSAHNLMPVLIDFDALQISRRAVMCQLKEKGIGTQVHFIPMYRHTWFQNHFGFSYQNFPQTELFYSRELSLPLYTSLSEKDVDWICDTLVKVLTQKTSALYSIN